jgi:hypothetical protein
MPPTRTDADNSTASTAELTSLLTSWQRSLRAQRASPNTVATYSASVERLASYLVARGMPTSPEADRNLRLLTKMQRNGAARIT